MDGIKVFSYNQSPITFQSGDSVMVNATQMAKPFGKSPKDWTRTQQSNDFIEALSNVRKCLFADLVIVKEGAPHLGGGTWMHEDVALEFARWLNPAFAIWCNDRIKELLTEGVATVSNDDQIIYQAMQVLQKRLEAQNQRVQILEGEVAIQEEKVRELAPKAKYTDDVLQSTSTYTFTQIAKELGLSSANALTNKLKELKVIFRQSGQWLLYSKYCGKNYTKTRTHTFVRSDGSMGTSSMTVWTEHGRIFIHTLLIWWKLIMENKKIINASIVIYIVLGFILVAGEDTSSELLTIKDIVSSIIGIAMWYMAYKISKIQNEGRNG